MNAPGPNASLDRAELRQRIALCFSAPELRDVCAELGVEAVSGTASELAHDLVRHFERGAGLAELVVELRRARPLVEWPELGPPPVAAPDERFAPEDRLEPGEAPPAPEPAEAPASPSRVEPEGPTLHDPFAGPAPTAGWPGTAGPAPAKEPSRGLDPRLLVAVAALTVLAAVVAYLAGRSAAGPSEASADASASGEPSIAAPAGTGPASRAAAAVDRSLENLARACEAQNGPADLLMRRVHDRCGPPPPPDYPASRLGPLPGRAVDPIEPRPRPGPADRTVPPTRPVAPPVPQGSGCLSACDGSHRSCMSGCGKEPAHSTQYGEHQACLSRCLGLASKCRLGCP